MQSPADRVGWCNASDAKLVLMRVVETHGVVEPIRHPNRATNVLR